MSPVASSAADEGTTASSASASAAAAAATPSVSAAELAANPHLDAVYPRPELIYAAADGAVGVVIALSATQSAILESLQNVMAGAPTERAAEGDAGHAIHGIGGFDHAKWRAYVDARRADAPSPARGVVDGDLVEQFLRLPPPQQRALGERAGNGWKLVGVAPNTDSIVALVERLSRLH
jgi:hypothetical protein